MKKIKSSSWTGLLKKPLNETQKLALLKRAARLKAVAEQIAKGKTQMTTGGPFYSAQQQAYNQQHNQYAGGINSNTYIATSGLGQGTYTTVTSTTAASPYNANTIYAHPGQVVGQPIGQAGHTSIAAPLGPSGNTHIVWITDAKGTQIAIEVDNSVSSLIQYINQIHSMNFNRVQYGAGSYLQPKFKMVEGDFSMDELEKAEELMESLNEKQESVDLCAAGS